MAINVVDLVKIKALTTGTVAITLGDAVPGYRGVEALTNGQQYSYSIQQGSEYEVGRGTYLSGTAQLTRSPLFSSNGGAALDLQPNASVAFVLLSSDLAQIKQGPPGENGPAGPAGNVAATLADLKAAPTTNLTMLYDQSTFNWSTGDYSGTSEDQLDVNVVESDSTALNNGAWVRQFGSKIQLAGGMSIQNFVDKLQIGTGAVSSFGPVDTTTDAAATLTTALASNSPHLVADQDIAIGTASVANSEGKFFTGGNDLIHWDAGDGQGKHIYNRRGRDPYQQFYGREYLAAWYSFIDITNTTTPAAVTLTGDSITESYVGPMLASLLNRVPNVTASNWGISSSTVEQWRRGTSFYGAGGAGEGKALANVMAAPPNLLTMAWPTNTPYYGGTDYADPSQHTGSPADAAWSLDQALATIRASFDVSQMSICIILPPSSSDGGTQSVEGGWKRDEFFVAKCREAILPLVEKYKVALFDQSFETPDASVDVGTTYTGFWHINGVHPVQGHLRLLANRVFDFLVPAGFRQDYPITAPSGFKRIISVNSAPAFFQTGINIDRGEDFPIAGFVETMVAADGFPRQINYGFQAQDYEFIRYSSGSPATWGSWIIRGRRRVDLTPATGFTLGDSPEEAASVVSGPFGLLTGWLNMTTPGPLSVGTTLATIADTYALPKLVEWVLPAYTLAGDGTSFEQFAVSIETDGTVKVAKATVGSLPRIYLRTGSYEIA